MSVWTTVDGKRLRQELGEMCACGCEEQLPAGSLRQYKRGHSPKPVKRVRPAYKPCLGCGTLISMSSKTGYCHQNSECRTMSCSIAMMQQRDPNRKCAECSGPINTKNTTDFCRANPVCQAKNDKVRQQRRNSRHYDKIRKTPKRQRARLPDSITWVLPEDGIIDALAIKLAATGIKRVALTEVERKIALKAMLTLDGVNLEEMRRRIHVSTKTFAELLGECGYEMVVDPLGDGSRRLLARKDRSTERVL